MTTVPMAAGWALPRATSVAVGPVVRATLLLFTFSIAFDWWTKGANPVGIELSTATAILFLASTLFDVRRCYRRLPATVVAFAAFLWVFVLAAIVARVAHGTLVIRLFANMTIVVVLFWALTNLLEDRRILRAVLLTLVVACGVRAAVQLLGVATTESALWTGGVRIHTFGQNANLSALILAGGLAATLGLRWSRLEPPRWLLIAGWPIAGLLAAAIIQTGSRGGLAAALLGVSVYFLRGATIAARVRNVILTALALTLIALAAWNSPMMRSRIEDSAVEGHLAGRERIYPVAIGMFLEKPLLGWGPIDNQYEIGTRFPALDRKPWRDAHNLVLELLTSTGIVGTLPFLFGLGLIVRSGWRARRGVAGLLPLALLAVGLGGTLSGTWITSKILWLGLAVAAATGARVADDSVAIHEEA